MSFDLQPLTAADVPNCVTIYFNAFQNPHSLACWPRVASVRIWWEKMIYDELDEPGSHWLKAVSKNAGDIAGYVKWVEPKPGVEPSVDLPAWPEDADQDLCNETFGAWARKHRELFGKRGHWCQYLPSLKDHKSELIERPDLEMVATDPAYQGQGIGTKLIRWGLEQADVQKMECYLEASPEAVRLSEKLGFHEADRTDSFIENERVKQTWYRNLFMIRPPK